MTIAAADSTNIEKMDATNLSLTKCLLTIILVYLGFSIYLKYKKRRKQYAYMDYFPGDKWYPLIGCTARFIGKTREEYFDTLKSLFVDYGPTVKIWIGSKPRLFVSKAEHLEIIFRNNTNINKDVEYKFLKPWLGHSLLLASGQDWKTKRRLFTSAFHFQILDKYSKVFYEKSLDLVSYLEKVVSKEEYFDISPVMTRCGMDVLAETAMGVKFNSLQDPTSEYAHAVSRLCEISVMRMGSRAYLLKNDFLFNLSKYEKIQRESLKIVNDANIKIIARRKQERVEQKREVQDEYGIKEKQVFLDILLDNAEALGLTDQELSAEVSTFMFTGQDTTAASVAFTLLAIGNHPEIQTKVHEELDAIIGRDQNRPITPQDIAQMEYLDRVLKESLRYFSFVPIIARTLDEEIILDGQKIPQGASIYCFLYGIHHDPKHWPNPNRFDPDRFLPESCKNRHPYSFVPFSAGARNCIGQKYGIRNSKIMLASLLRKFNVTGADNPEDLKMYMEVVLRPQKGIHLKMEKRD